MIIGSIIGNIDHGSWFLFLYTVYTGCIPAPIPVSRSIKLSGSDTLDTHIQIPTVPASVIYLSFGCYIDKYLAVSRKAFSCIAYPVSDHHPLHHRTAVKSKCGKRKCYLIIGIQSGIRIPLIRSLSHSHRQCLSMSGIFPPEIRSSQKHRASPLPRRAEMATQWKSPVSDFLFERHRGRLSCSPPFGDAITVGMSEHLFYLFHTCRRAFPHAFSFVYSYPYVRSR